MHIDHDDCNVVDIKTKPRSKVDNQYMLKVAYQEESMSSVDIIGEEDISNRNLWYDDGNYEDLDVDILMVVRLGDREGEEEEED